MKVCALKKMELFVIQLLFSLIFVAFWACIMFVAVCCFAVSLCCFLTKCQGYIKIRKTHEYKNILSKKNIDKK